MNIVYTYFRLVAFHICNRLPLKHDNKSCVKDIAYAQLKTEITHTQGLIYYSKDLQQFL